jgi:hypothetical protein
MDRHLMSYPVVEDAVYEILVEWKRGDTIVMWNEYMAWVTEEFGLPGQEWSADVHTDGMLLKFRDPRCVTMCRLKFGL